MNKIRELIRMFFSKEFFMFIIIGCVNTLSGTLFSAGYAQLMGEVIAFIPGYLTGIVVAYTLNTHFTFHTPFSWRKLIAYGFSTIPNFLIQLITVYIGVMLLKIDHILCYLIAAIIGVPVTFIILKLFVFVKK